MVLGVVVSALALGAADSGHGTAANSGGTLRLVGAGFNPALDPALTRRVVGWNALWYGACATLMAFRDAPAPDGLQVEPEAAAGPPKVSRDGRTYVFTVRKGLRFNDGTPLTAANFAHALGRVRDPAMGSPGAALFSDVKASASGRRLRIVLTRPSGDLLIRLALAYACPVPLGFPVDPAGKPLTVGSGPYYLADYESDGPLVLERNRYYDGSRPHRIDRMVITIGGDIDDNIRAVAEGRAEMLASDIPIELRPDLARRYGMNREQFFRIRGTFLTALVLNTSRPLFRNNAPLRKAVNFALDRAAIVRSRDGWEVGRQPTDQVLTRSIPGWVDRRIYPLKGPNLRLAGELAKGNLRGGKAVLWVPQDRSSLDQAQTIVRNLREIGLEVEPQALSNEVLNARAGTPGGAYDMSLEMVALDYPDPANMIIRHLAGVNARKPTDNSNHAYFDVPAYNRRMAAADRLVGSARSRAFSELDADIMRREAPWAPLYENSSSLFVSKRVGCLKVHPVFRFDYAAICLR